MGPPGETVFTLVPSLEDPFGLVGIDEPKIMLALEDHRPHHQGHGEDHQQDVSAPIDEVADRFE
jgi:hypothetical protein